MNTVASKHNPRTGLFRLAAVGLMSLAASLSALAQATTPAPAAADQNQAQPAVTTTTATPAQPSEEVVVLNEFTVNGSYAGSLEMAAQLKQDSPAITEVIAPEDIGKLPDVSIADALARLTALTSQRVNGRFQDITIRGLGPDYNVGTLDGVEQATTDNNRAVEYDQYASELIGGVTVYKTGQADMVGGIGGTVDLQTTSPLAADHRVVALNWTYNWTEIPQLTPGVKPFGESYNASYIDQFFKGTEGIYIGFAHTENPYEGQQFQSWGPPYPTAPDGNLIIGGLRAYAQSELLTRDSIVAVIESKPNDFVHSKIDLLLSYYHDDQPLRGMEIPMAEWSGASLQPGYTVTNGAITNYTLKNVNPIVRNMDTLWNAHLKSVIWNLDLGPNSSWPVHFQMGWSSAEKRQEVLETYSGLGFNNTETDSDTLQVTQYAGELPQLVSQTTPYSNPNLLFLTDPQGWGVGTLPITGQEGYLKFFQSYDVADSFKVFTKHELGASIFKDVEVGVSYSQRFKQFGQNPSGYLINADDKPTAPLPETIGTTDLSFIGNLYPVAFDPNAAYYGGRLTFIPNPNLGNWVGDNYKVSEDITRPFIKFDLKGNLGSMPFEGNLGFAGDFAKQSSNGLSGNGSNIVVPVTGGASYADLLPSLNLIFKPTTQDFIRLFVGREEQRPEMYQMRAARNYSFNPSDATSTSISPWGGTAGNPSIHPWISNSVDVDLEHYFAHGGGYVSVAFFEKKLLSYIYQQNTVTDFTGYPYTSPQPPLLYQGITSEFVNGQGGNVTGVEATVQVSSDIFTKGMFRGFGIVLNGLLVDSSIKPFGPTGPSDPLEDMSKKSANVTVYYERGGFSARVTEHYQGETREYVVQFGAPTFNSLGTANDGFSNEIPFHTIDAKVSYTFKSGMFNGLTYFIDGRNLNNAPQITYYNGDPREPTNYFKFGASYSTGLSYKF